MRESREVEMEIESDTNRSGTGDGTVSLKVYRGWRLVMICSNRRCWRFDTVAAYGTSQSAGRPECFSETKRMAFKEATGNAEERGVQRESHPSQPEVTRRLRYTRSGFTVESSSPTWPHFISTILPSITLSIESTSSA